MKLKNSLPPSIDEIMENQFYFLDEGTRVKAYHSNDGKYVIKLLKNPVEINNAFIKLGIDLGKVSWTLTPDKPLEMAKLLYRRSWESYHTAYHELKEETRLVYFHNPEIPC